METLIELYVNEPFDDLAAFAAFRPERVVFLSAGFMPDCATRDGFTGFIGALNGKERETEVRFTDVGNRSIGSLFKKIGEVVRQYPDCVVDMTGGPTGALIAAHRYCTRNKTRAFFYDDRRRKFINIYGMAEEIAANPIPGLDVEQIIRMGGGLVTGSGHSAAPYAENEECANRVLDIYCANIANWNAFSEYLQFACRSFYDPKTGLFMAPSTLLNNSSLLYANKRLLNQLAEAGAVKELMTDGESISFRFANTFIKELLTTVGMCLELLVYVSAKGSGAYDDVRMSVVFDWDGVIHGNFNDTVNEIDAVMTKGMQSVFVSCKTARPDTRDLYEIDYLGHRFGGRFASIALVTACDLSGEAWSIYMRARDMGVIVIERSDIEKGREHIARKLAEPEWLTERPKQA